jgi:hypothetical protein
MLQTHNMRPGTPITISLRRVESLTVSELDDIWAVTSRYVEIERPVRGQNFRTPPEVGLWRPGGGPLVGLFNFAVYSAV